MGADEFRISYGRGHLSLALPAAARATVIRKTTAAQACRSARGDRVRFERPVGSTPLAELARGRRSACILICDITRPVPNRLFLRPMIETLIGVGRAAGPDLDPGGDGSAPAQSRRGARRAGRRPLGARDTCGSRTTMRATRPPMSTSAARGRAARRSSSTGASSRPTLRIATGLVEPHFMAGWSGGRKVVAPGVAHHETIRTFHSARFMEDPLAVQCNLDRQSAARGAARDRAHAGRRLCAQHRDRRGARPRLRDLRRDRREPSGGGRFRRRRDPRARCRGGSRRSSRRRPAIRSTRPIIRPSRAW